MKNIPEGKMFHSIQYGKVMMGSHASQLTVEDRWKIIRYVQALRNRGGVAAVSAPVATDSVKTIHATVDSTKRENIETAKK